MVDREEFTEWFKTLLSAIGIALHEWAQVEDCMFTLFDKLLRAPTEELSSIVFYSSPSFESKRTLMERIASNVLDKTDAITWKKINKTLKSESEFRGKIAHYGVQINISNKNDVMAALLKGEEPVYEFEEPHLRRTEKNKISTTKDPAETNLTEILKHVSAFSSLKKELEDFTTVVSMNYPHPSLRAIQTLGDLFQLPKTPHE